MLPERRNRARRERLVAVNVPSPRTVRFLYRPPRPTTIAGFTDRPQFLQGRMRRATRRMAFWPRTHCHCGRSHAISWPMGLLRRPAPRNDGVALMIDDLAYTSA